MSTDCSSQNVWPNSTNKVPGAHGVGRAKAIEGYAKWFKEELLPGSKFTMPHFLLFSPG